MEGTVQTARARTANWRAAQTNEALAALDRVRTREQSRAALRLIDRSLFRLGELSELTVEPMESAAAPARVGLARGLMLFLHRGRPRDVELRTRAVSAAIRGTEFHVSVDDNGRTVLTLFDGEVELSNPQGTLRLVSGEQGTVDPGQPPVKTPMLVAKNDLIQWCLYYPAVLDAGELALTPAEENALASSLAAYRAGDLLQALALVPAGFQPGSDSARVYLAAVLLAAGNVEAALPWLNGVAPGAANADRPSSAVLADALRAMILVVKSTPAPATNETRNSATWRLVASYRHQARANLDQALAAAREATSLSPEFAFAWARVAELEFSFGRRHDAQAALERSLRLAPRNAQAVALRGFLLAAADRIEAALTAFNEAIALDGALGNAWLGRGLCRIRRGALEAGREDLQTAALLEPQRALFRSYLGKAWNELGDLRHAEAEFALAKANDPGDPTAHLYEALLLRQENRINEAIAALERSQELNDRRRLFRSRLLLDEDRAVRAANLAALYRDAGLTDWSAREAGKAVNADYANWSAHLFLAGSFNDLRNARTVNQRYETAALSEYLLANLLAPASGGALAQRVSQQEYARLFERNALGVASVTEYQDRGAWTQQAAQYGLLNSSAYSVEGFYRSDPGERANQFLEQSAVTVRLKQDLGPQDSFYAEFTEGHTRAGDLNQLPDPALANRRIHVHDDAGPLWLAGYHHEWSPGQHTLLLASRLEGELRVNDPLAHTVLTRTGTNGLDLFHVQPMRQRYDSELKIYSGELQHIAQLEPFALILGGRVQGGEFDTVNEHRLTGGDPYDFGTFNGVNPPPQESEARFERETIYAYATWRVVEPLQFVAGVAGDWLEFPVNYRYAPVSDGTDRASDVLPKAGFIWNVTTNAAARFAWTRSLGGASFDQSIRLEPVQVAGFNQAFRSLVPETLVGANAGAPFETFDVAWEQRWPTRTYLGVGAQWLRSDFDRQRGAYFWNADGSVSAGRIGEDFEFEERGVGADVSQLIGRQFVLGASYAFRQARLDTRYPQTAPRVEVGFDEAANLVYGAARRAQDGDLHQLALRLLWNHPAGWFAGTEGTWSRQEASGTGGKFTADFWQWHARAGWRSPRRRVEASVALLNILDERGGLHPINLHATPPSERTFATMLRLNF